MRIRYLSLLSLGLLIGSQANAAFRDPRASDLRLGFGAGAIKVDTTIAGQPSIGWSLISGYDFNRYFAAEVSYVSSGDAFGSGKTIPGGTQFDSVNNHYWNVSAVGTWPVTDLFSVYGRLGLLNWGGTSQVTQGATVTLSDISGNELFYGVGTALTIDNGMLRLEYQRTKLLERTATYISFSAVWKVKL